MWDFDHHDIRPADRLHRLCCTFGQPCKHDPGGTSSVRLASPPRGSLSSIGWLDPDSGMTIRPDGTTSRVVGEL